MKNYVEKIFFPSMNKEKKEKREKEKKMASTLLLVSSLLALSLTARSALGGEHIIETPSDFIQFVNEVNSGSDYTGTTVLLDADISLSEALDPIGKDSSNQFLGVFDGQGHTISGLKMSSTSQYTGLFGYSTGLTIRNVVLDSSCSFTSSYDGSSTAHVGGIIGYCSVSKGTCTIYDVVTMAPVTFSGSMTYTDCYLYLGGIAGHLSASSSGYDCTVKNCANYGSVTQSGYSKGSYVGGIAGYLDSGSAYKYVQNCFNYGTITQSGIASSLPYLGGIIGSGTYSQITNCLSGGIITLSRSGYIGSIAGTVGSSTSITYCYFTTDVGEDKLCGYGTISNTTGSPSSPSVIDLDLITNMNSQTGTGDSWKKWVLLHLNGGKISNLSQEVLSVTANYLPAPVKEGEAFQYWCEDGACKKIYDPTTSDLAQITDLYAKFGVEVTVTVTVSLDVNGGDVAPSSKQVTFNTPYGDLPVPNKTGYIFIGWFTEIEGGGAVNSSVIVTISSDHTLYAHWREIILKCIVTFDANGGDVTPSSKQVTFNAPYGDLPTSNKTGYNFTGWFTEIEGGSAVNSSVVVTISSDHTLYAHWREIPTKAVEIVFETKDLNQEDVERIIRQFTSDDFKITSFEEEGDETRVIIEFVDAKDARSFIETIKESSMRDIVKKVGFVYEPPGSLSPLVYPSLLCLFVSLL